MCDVLDRIENRGRAEGMARGRAEGMLATLASLVKDGLITAQEAARRSHLTVAEFETRVRELQL